MNARTSLVLFFLTVIGMALTFPADAVSFSSLEIGLKVPLAGLASLSLSEQLRLEISAVIPGFSAPLVSFEGMLAAKLYPGAMDVGGVTLRPFVGGGAKVMYAVGEMVPGLVVLAGLEHTASDLPLTLFAEGSGTLIMSANSPVIDFALSLGARYAFAP